MVLDHLLLRDLFAAVLRHFFEHPCSGFRPQGVIQVCRQRAVLLAHVKAAGKAGAQAWSVAVVGIHDLGCLGFLQHVLWINGPPAVPWLDDLRTDPDAGMTVHSHPL